MGELTALLRTGLDSSPWLGPAAATRWDVAGVSDKQGSTSESLSPALVSHFCTGVLDQNGSVLWGAAEGRPCLHWCYQLRLQSKYVHACVGLKFIPSFPSYQYFPGGTASL